MATGNRKQRFCRETTVTLIPVGPIKWVTHSDGRRSAQPASWEWQVECDNCGKAYESKAGAYDLPPEWMRLHPFSHPTGTYYLNESEIEALSETDSPG